MSRLDAFNRSGATARPSRHCTCTVSDATAVGVLLRSLTNASKILAKATEEAIELAHNTEHCELARDARHRGMATIAARTLHFAAVVLELVEWADSLGESEARP